MGKAYTMSFKLHFVLLASFVIHSSLACNGFKAKLVSLETCGGPDEIISVEDGFSVILNKKCELIPTGCVVHKAFKTAQAKYSISKDGLPLKEGEADLCEVAGAASTSSDGKNLMKIFALPEHCPVEEGRICANENTKADMSKYKGLLSMAKGKIFVNSSVVHDTVSTYYGRLGEVYQFIDLDHSHCIIGLNW